MRKNDNLHKAKSAKNDEFYTQIEDINAEMVHYENHFKGKTIFMNCDDPTYSNFWKYFHLDFERLGLKKIISTHYELDLVPSYKLEYDGGNDLDIECGVKTELTQNGDFRSPECIEILQDADIVVTNPPFSLFREYVAQLMEYDKKFIVIGNVNALTYKEIFPLIRDDKMWIGYKFNGKPMCFIVPDDYPLSGTVNGYLPDGRKYVGVGGTCWFTNLDIPKRHKLFETPYLYSKKDELYPDLYPKYDNYDAINVDKTNEIPMDYDGVMGVPITFLDKYNPEQFEIVAFRKGEDGKDLVFTREREFNRTFVSLYDFDSGEDKKRRRENQWETYLRSNNNQTDIEPIDFFYPNSTTRASGTLNGLINGKETYRRVLIQKK